eukprot:8520070-Pyramimonas_sp.AAC.1
MERGSTSFRMYFPCPRRPAQGRYLPCARRTPRALNGGRGIYQTETWPRAASRASPGQRRKSPQ